MDKKVVIFGAGYVGFSLAVVLSKVANVALFDVDCSVVKGINQGCSPIMDQGIEKLLKRAIESKRLHASKYCEKTLTDADYVVLALPSNFNEQTGEFDTSIIESVLKKIALTCRAKAIVIKSTIPVGFTDRVSKLYNFDNCFHSPEFLREGKAVHDNLYPSRIVIGSKKPPAVNFVELLCRAARVRNIKTVYTDNKTAEVIKLASNTYLATRVAFFNEIDSLAMKLNLNIEDLIDGVCADTRIGDGYNNPSFGYGGYCLPKDVKQFQGAFVHAGVNAPLIGSIHASNESRILEIMKSIISTGALRVGIYRIQMKQGSDNARESVSLSLFNLLHENSDLQVKIYEPEIELAEELKPYQITNLHQFTDWSDIIVANRDAVELMHVKQKVLTRDVYNES